MNLLDLQGEMIRTRFEYLLIGIPRAFGDGGEMSAIARMVSDQSLMLGFEGLEGNRAADPLHRGGHKGRAAKLEALSISPLLA